MVEATTRRWLFGAAAGAGIIPGAVSAMNSQTGAAAGTRADGARVQFTPSGRGAVTRDLQVYLRERAVSVRSFGAIGDGVADDTEALKAALAASLDVYVPPGVFLTRETLPLRQYQTLRGAGTHQSVIQGVGVIGAVIEIAGGDPDFLYHVNLSDLRLTGVATTGLNVDFAVCLNVRDISLEGLRATDGFRFANTFACQYANLWTNGADIANACFLVGEAFNANDCRNWYTSNRSVYSLLIDGGLYGGSRPSHGSTWTNLCVQSSDYGIVIGQYRAATFNGTYMEDIAHPVRLGDKSAGKLAAAIAFNGGDFAGPYQAHPRYDDRLALFDLDYAIGVTIDGVDFSGAFNCGNACPLSIDGDGVNGFALARVHRDGGVWRVHSVEVVCEGSGYTSATVTAGGTGVGATFTVAITNGKLSSINVARAGSGYEPANCPVLFTYNYARRVTVGGAQFNCGFGDESPMYPFLVHRAGAAGRASITLLDDVSWRGPAPTFGSAELRKTGGMPNGVGVYQYALVDYDASGAQRSTLYQCPQYP